MFISPPSDSTITADDNRQPLVLAQAKEARRGVVGKYCKQLVH